VRLDTYNNNKWVRYLALGCHGRWLGWALEMLTISRLSEWRQAMTAATVVRTKSDRRINTLPAGGRTESPYNDTTRRRTYRFAPAANGSVRHVDDTRKYYIRTYGGRTMMAAGRTDWLRVNSARTSKRHNITRDEYFGDIEIMKVAACLGTWIFKKWRSRSKIFELGP